MTARAVFAPLVAGFTVAIAHAACTPTPDTQVVRVEIDKRAPFAGGHAFGDTGPYEKIVGRLHIEVDPDHPANSRVSDLGLAPTNERGRVEVWTDFFLLKPLDAGRGNGRLLYDVANRGNKVALGTFNGGGGNDPSTLEDAGDGFLMEQGYSILWSGWSGDVQAGNDRVQIGVPVARNAGGSSIVGRIYAELESTVYGLYIANVLEPGSDAAMRGYHSLPFDWGSSLPYPSVELDNSSATLVKRPRRGAEGAEIPRDKWSFGRLENGAVVPDPSWVYVEEGFEPGWLYDLVYEGRDPRVTGLGLAATRDVISFFRHATEREGPRANPLAGTVELAYGYGGSQSGRFLHHFVYEGFNADPGGRIVFDAIMPHVAGAGKGIFNHRFGQTTRHGSHHEEGLYPSDFFPFNSVRQRDPVTGASGSMLDRARASGHVPRVFFTQTSTEYWSRAASLLHTDVEGKVDADIDQSVRIYMIAGTAHNSMTGGAYQSPVNRATTRPAMRALLVALDRWAADGVEPPASRYPRIDDGTLVDLAAFREGWPRIPGAAAPEGHYRPLRLDPGPRWYTEGIADDVPPKIGPAFETLVPMVDADGNELAGIRLPHVAVPLATWTGWNLRDASWGAGGMLTRWMGSYLAFPRTQAEGSQLSDPRRSVEERYRTHDEYVAHVERVCRELVAGGYLLERDAPALIREAAARAW
ncbi:MAG: alpha/beta hydrolase domain-containing protein [Gemmatimonadota bacterium]|nr:alpha/beta hydrolase domain-containing protein [Gemmatimonadota bacterium]MDE2866390.1 alpha/beta hydrolase domain-containing protein [Gemmatimonadota bacterium]